MRTIDHENITLVLGAKKLLGGLDAVGVEVGAAATTTVDDIAVLVTLGGGDGNETLLGGTHEVVAATHRLERVDGGADGAIGGVLEADGEGKTGGQLSVELGLGGTSTHGADTDQVGGVLGRDGVEHLASDGDTEIGDVSEKLTGNLNTLVDVVRVVDVGVVDQTLPADRGPGLLKIGPHDDAQVILQLLGKTSETLSVLDGSLGVMDTTGTNQDQEAVRLAADDVTGLNTAVEDGEEGVSGETDLVLHKLRRSERRVFLD